MSDINSDPAVMEFFPATISPVQTEAFIRRMNTMHTEKGYCYFAVDRLDDGTFIGFTGLCEQTFEWTDAPFVDIGWRLKKECWNKGFATEGARRCVEFAFGPLGLANIKSIAPVVNLKSIRVMEKIGMTKQMEFIHPKLAGNRRLERCVCYHMDAE